MISKAWDKEFRQRLEKAYDELKWLYCELYHDDQQAFDYFCTVLNQYYEERSSALKELDRYRLSHPDWYKKTDMLGMQMYVNAFAGNLQGVRSHLDYIKECGVNYIHLMPLLESPAGRSDGGYAVSNFRRVQPELGTMEDLAELAADCHSQDICLCLDFVMNHTSEDHEWAVRARQGEKEFQDRYFFFDNWDIPMAYEATVPQVFPTTAPGNFSWCEAVRKVVMTTFYPYQWDLNYANPVVFNDMTANMLYLYNQGIDIIRLDAVPYIWKCLGTNCRNLPQVHNLVRMMHIAADIVCPGTLLLGEVVMEPSKVVPYFGTVDKPECQMLYNVTTMASTWHTVATRDVRLLKHQLGTVFALPHEYMFLNYLRCHDDIGWGLDYDYLRQFGLQEVAHKKYLNDYLTGKWAGSDMRGELYNDDPRLGDARLCGTTASLCGLEAAEYENDPVKADRAIQLDIMLHAFLLTQSGVPIIYSGDEIGQLNDYSYHDNSLKWDDSRYIHRGDFNWDQVMAKDDPTTRQGRIFTALRRLEKLRASHMVFDNNADAWIIETYNDHVLGIGRYYEGEKLIALFNFSEDPQVAWIQDEPECLNLWNEEYWDARNIGLPGYGFVWLYKDMRSPEEGARAALPENSNRRKKTA
ncbi:MAG: amylosucrase [Blautia sp.]|nr:amylosucrase [Blautia sp.]